jgi:hypothetical protein|tara:strand:+ start:1630 stop:1893 length:264 start_codon:yes stop_codon:yes gene_type:complete
MAKDACYNKVKARYKVFPSAYASGAIAKCRKVGASNWGNKSKKAKGGILAAKEGKVIKMTKRKSNNSNIARGCGKVMSKKRKVTKYS